jgi:uncharacterized protein
MMTENEKNRWSVISHLSALVGYIVPFGNIIAPMIVWLWKGNDDALVKEHSRASLNFQINVWIWIVLSIVGLFGLPAIFGVWTKAPILITSAAVAFALSTLFIAAVNLFFIFKNAARGYIGKPPQYYWYWHVLK